jgi:hypothetical protein
MNNKTSHLDTVRRGGRPLIYIQYSVRKDLKGGFFGWGGLGNPPRNVIAFLGLVAQLRVAFLCFFEPTFSSSLGSLGSLGVTLKSKHSTRTDFLCGLLTSPLDCKR